jgi:phosphorylcholine metabolism protein LicD
MAGKQTLDGKTGEKALEMLQKICILLNDNNIPYVLEAGTLLGIIRENRLLPWDNDVDITITEQFVDELLELQEKIEELGYRMKVRRFKQDLGPFKKGMIRMIKIQTKRWLFFKGYSLMDIFVKYDIEGAYQWVISTQNPVLKKAPKHFYDQKKVHEFMGTHYLIPADYEDYLEYHYGKDWRIPKKDWDFRLDDSCEKTLL